MQYTVKYSSIFFVVTAILVSIIVLVLVIDYYSTHYLVMNFCLDAGFRYEERSLNGVIRGYCVFDDIPCSESDFSECPALDFFLGSCWPCLKQTFDCSNFTGVEFCPQDLNPVCARIRVGVVEPFNIIERTIGNACTACFNSLPTELVTSYVNGSCPA